MPLDMQMAAEFAQLGVSVATEELDDEDVFELWDINVAVFEVFQALDTQWRFVTGLSSAFRTGLDYPGVLVVMDAYELSRASFRLIQAMETAALEAYAQAETPA